MTKSYLSQPVVLAIVLLFSLVGVRADSITFSDQWKDSAQTAGGKVSVVSVDTGSFSLSLTIPGLSSLTTTQLTEITQTASFGDISLPGEFTNSPSESINSITTSQTELDNANQPVVVGQVSLSRSGNVATISGSVKNPTNAKPFPIFADQFLGSNGPIQAQRIVSISLSGPITYSLQKVVYITGKGSVTQDSQHTNVYSVSVTGAANFTAPTLTFSHPATRERLTNENLTAEVLVKDQGTVTNVEFSLNGGTFQPGTQDTSNHWSAAVELTPGSNTLSAYAMDQDGNSSTTNKVTFQYAVVAQLIVNTNGPGKLTPNYNGDYLTIGTRYTMKATPAKDFGFYYWNVGAGMSNNATLNFYMVTNLVITANFRDITPPPLAITAPKANEKYSNTVITVSGTASDNVGVAGVAVQMNDGGWMSANGSNSWSADLLPVKIGANIVQAYAMDAAGNYSKTNTVTFTGEPPDLAPTSLNGFTIQVAPNGSDAISASFDATNFSQTDTNLVGDSGTSFYSYTPNSLTNATLDLTFQAPPNLSNNVAEDIQLNFTNLYVGNYTNVDSTNSGTFAIVPATDLVPTNWTGHTINATNINGAIVTGVNFLTGTEVLVEYAGFSSSGNYAVTQASPVCAMFAINYTFGAEAGTTSYLQFTFTSSTGGNYERNIFNSNGLRIGFDFGGFTFQ